jgi:hypothetical protein
VAIIFGIVLTVIGIGCAIEAQGLITGGREYGGGMGLVGLLFGVIALIAFIGAIVLFVKAYRNRKGKK